MKSIFDKDSRDALIARIEKLDPDSRRIWGKMDSYQMLKHCCMSEELYQGKKSYKRLFIGRLFGAKVLKGILKNDDAMKKNQPTHPELKMKGSGDFEKEKKKWIQLLHGYHGFTRKGLVHPFFGKMSTAEIGGYVYKHTDHHLRQFGV